ncbi:unnamed protein product [Moneuplotes crassus]|uniref:AB hydrolase-1 domain-containing protein n=1 Tax=Euplotes crassus TaxID=5936 RepID=A0AAD1XGM1_EUPCR|nr:unnamed protein product [Moneuplotes crassus]
MASFWTWTSDEKLQKAEDVLVKLAGLEDEEFKSYPVKFTFTARDWKEDYNEQMEYVQSNSWVCFCGTSQRYVPIEDNEYIWTYEFGDTSKPHIVIVHGFGGAGMIFFKMFKQLSQHFHVYLIDILGMGRSNRGDFDCETYEECESYFVNSIEKWRHKIGIGKMNLFGHSFGGFICSKYALRYAERINKLMLFSPWASEACTEDQLNGLEEEMKEQPLKRRIRYKFMKAIYQRSTLFEMARKAGRFLGSYMIKKFIHGRFSNELDAEQLEAIKEYLSQIILRKGSSEYGFVKMFPYFNRSENAILNHLDEYNELNLEISFYYGTKDWMDTCFNQTKVSQKLKDVGKKVYLIQDAGHHLYFDNPDESCDMILDNFKTGLKTLTSNNQILT